MKFLHLVWAGLARRKARLTLTVVSVAAAFLLFGLLASVNAAFKSVGQNAAAAHRLVTLARSGYAAGLPVGLYGEIQAVPGVRAASYVSGFFGSYQTLKHPVGGEAIGPHYFRVFPQYTIAPAALRAYRKTQMAVLAGRLMARRYHWTVGQQIPIRSPGFLRRNGSDVWTFLIAGIYTSKPRPMENAIIMHWSDLDLGRAAHRGRVDAFLERIAHTRQAGLIAQRIDALSANSSHQTKTQLSSALAARTVRQVADLGLIVYGIMGAVFFTLVLLTGNAIAYAVRERTPEWAILKTVGFSSRAILAVVLGESVLLLALGALAGLLLAHGVVVGVNLRPGPHVPLAPVAEPIWAQGLALAVLVGLVAGALPAVRAARQSVTDGLRNL